MTVETSLTITVTPDPDYKFDVYVSTDELYVTYSETARGLKQYQPISFGSREEMEAVAKAMLRALAATAQ